MQMEGDHVTDKPKRQSDDQKFMDAKAINIGISAVLFVTNFLLMYFVCQRTFPDLVGFPRVAAIWVGAYAMTWVMSYSTRGLARLVLSLIMLGVLYGVLLYQPS